MDTFFEIDGQFDIFADVFQKLQPILDSKNRKEVDEDDEEARKKVRSMHRVMLLSAFRRIR